MLSSGVETQPVPLDTPMSAGAQELCTKLPLSVSPELPEELEPRVIPDAKLETSSSLGRTLPLEPQRTNVENFSQDTDPMGDREEPKHYELVADCAAGDSLSSGVLKKENAAKRGEQEEEEETTRTGRAPQEGVGQGQEQPSPAAVGGARGSCQVDLGKQLKQDLSQDLSLNPFEDEPHHTEENQGNVQVTTETLPKPTEEGQGMKVNGTKMISNAEHRNNKVSKSLLPGCIDCPDVDKIMSSGEVSETSTLVSLEPLSSVEPGLTKAPSTEKECETSNIRPLWLPAPEDNANLPLHSRKVLSRLSLDHEAIDNHHCNCVCDTESSSKTSIPQAKSKEGAVLPLEADPQGSCFSLSLSSVESGSISLDECGSRDDLQKMEKLFQTREVLIGEGSASRLEEDERVERVKSNMLGGEESIPLPLKYVSEQKRCAPDSCHTHSSSPATQRSLQQENSPSEIQENFKKHKGKRVTCPCNKYHDEDSLEESYSLAMQNEETERTISEDLSVLGKNIDIQNPGSLINNHSSLGSGIEKRDPTCSVPDEPLKTVNKVSEVNSVLPQLWTYKKCDLTNQPEAKETIRIVSGGVTLFVDEQRIASNEQNEFASYSAESSEDKGKLLCFLSGKMSFEACDHKEATAPQELSLDGNAEDLCEGTSGISQQQASSVGEDEDKVLASHQPILAQMRNVKDTFHPDATTCHASSQNHDDSAKAGSFNRVPSNVVTELAAMSDLDKEVAELTEETPDVEHESAQSQRCRSCYHRVHSTPEGVICSEGINHKSTTSPEAENQSVLISEDKLVPREPHYPGTKNGLVESIRSVRHPSGENELFREEIQGSLEKGKVRNEVTSCSLLSRALNNSTLALSHVTPGNFKARSARKVGLEKNKLRTHSKEAALPCESHPSEHSILGSNLSSNIPSPKELKNLCVNTEHSGIRIIKQADGTNQGLNCQSDLNSPIEYWSESKSSMNKHLGTGILEVQHTNNHNSKNVAKPNKGLSSSHEELLVKDLSNIQPSYSLPKKNIFESSLGNEKSFACRAELAHLSNNIGEEDLEMKKCNASGSHRKQEESSLLQQDRPLRSDQLQEEIHVLSEGLNDQDSISPCVSDSFNMRSLKTMTSCKGMSSGEQRDHGLHNAVNWESKKLCQDRETHGPVGSLAHGMRSVTNHEPNIKLSDTVNVLLESTHCGTTGGLGPQTNYTFDNEESLEVYSKEHMLESARTTPLLISFQENSSSGSDGPLGEKAETKPLPESGDVKVLPEILKSSTLKTKVKKNPPGRTPNVDKGDKKGTLGTFQPNSVSSGPPSFELNPKNKMNRRETEEHPGTSNDLKIREESEGKTLKGDGGDKSSDAHRPHFKRKKICGETEAQTAQTVQGCKCLKGGREGMQPKKRGISSQQKAPLNAKPFIRPTVGPSSQDLTRQSCLKGYACKQNTLKDITGAVLTKDDSEAGRQTLDLLPDIESSLDSRFSISAMICQDTSGPGCDKIQDTFAVTPYQRKSLPPLKKGLSISYHEPIKTGRQMNDVQKWILLKNASETISVKEHKALSWSSTAPPSSSSVASHMPKPKAMRRLLLNSARLQKPTKESALLNKLSILARKLLATSTATHDLGSQPHSAELLPVAGNYKRLRFKKLQDESSYNMMQLNLHVGDDGCNKTLDSQTLALYPLEALRVGFLDLMNRMPSLQFNAQIFPLSFHINVDSELTTDSMRIFSEHCSPPETASGGDPIYPPQPPKWTFSFHMSQASSGIATFREDTELGCDLLSHPALQTLSPRQAPGSNAITKVRADCSVLGLHTVLALSSPGCYRIWTRRRSLSSHLPTIQRLFLTQFTQGFKGLRLPASLSNSLFPPLPYSVGRVLSIWSQHGPSACPFEITTLHSKHSKWPPTLGIRNSHAILPHVPLLGQEATTARTRGSPVRPGSPFSSLAPKSCLAFEPVVSVLRLSASDFQIPAFKELRRVPSAGSSQHSSATQKEIEPEKRPKKVSQIRIRKTIPRPDPNLTPMGLPRPKRLKKKEFSLEEIYTNKNYKSPPTSRCLETIFEEPKERNGALISVSQQKRKRVLEFQDFTVPRKRRNRGKIKAVGSFTRAKKAALQSQELDALLIQKLMDLEAFLAKEGEEEPTSSC